MDAERPELCGEKAPMEKRVYRPRFYWVWLTWLPLWLFCSFSGIMAANVSLGKTFAENPVPDGLPFFVFFWFVSWTMISIFQFVFAHKYTWIELDADCLVIPSRKRWRFCWVRDSRKILLSEIDLPQSRFRYILGSTLILHSGEKVKFSLIILYFGPSQIADFLARISERTGHDFVS